jgi:hypothetical protein
MGEEISMFPFDSYPDGGRKPLGQAKGSNCRRGYGLQFMVKTGQTNCAYCGSDLTASYEAWLTMALDHVVPAGVCLSMGISSELSEDFSNTVLACAACNGFCNRYRPGGDFNIDPLTIEKAETFYDLRDRIFAERKQRIALRHESERLFFAERRWEWLNGQQVGPTTGKKPLEVT